MARQGFADMPYDAPPASFTALNTFTAEANLFTPNLWTLIPAFDMRAGKIYMLRAGGICQSATAINWTFTPRIGTSATPASNATLGGSAVVPSGGIIPASSPWYAEFTMVVRSLGVAAAGATVTGNGFVVWPTTALLASQTISMGGTVATTVDHTINQGLVLSATCGTSSATNSIQCQWVQLQPQN
jgi:hypothetical protein